MNSSDKNLLCPKNKLVWLSILFGLTLVMIFVGGLTRLTGSGLSMVSWNLIQGIIPPITDGKWQAVFEEYKRFPEYQLVNSFMSLGDFKSIFYYEYIHRLLGRVIGLVTLLPPVYFLLKKQLSKREIFHFAALFFLVSFQGGFGWYMVKSGLIDEPAVSHFRLAGHFSLAMAFLGYITFLSMPYLKKVFNLEEFTLSDTTIKKWILNSIMALFLWQVFYGALTAGLDAGLVSSTYPKMLGEWVPLQQFGASMGFDLWMENPFFIHFFHRHFGMLVAILLLLLSFKLLKQKQREFKIVGGVLLILSLLQPTLGIVSILFNVPVMTASLHQLVAILIFECLLFVKWRPHSIFNPPPWV